MEITRQILPGADEKLAASLLGDAEFHTFLDLGMDTVPELACLRLDTGEVLPSGSGTDPEDVFHDENLGLEVLHMPEKFTVKVPPRIFLEAFAMVGSVHLPGGAETLAGRTAYDEVDVAGADEGFQIGWRKPGQVFFKDVGDVREVGLENLNGFVIEIDRSKPFESRPLQPEAETAASAEKIKESGLGSHKR